MRQLEVRHCAAPSKLLGWIQVPDTMMVLGKELAVMRPRSVAAAIAGLASHPAPAPDLVTFKVASLLSGFGSTYLALRADGHSAADCSDLLAMYHFVAAR